MSRIWQVIGSQGIIAGLKHQLGQETAHSAPPISDGGCSQEEVLFIYATPGTKPRDCPTSVLRHWLLPLFSPLICSFTIPLPDNPEQVPEAKLSSSNSVCISEEHLCTSTVYAGGHPSGLIQRWPRTSRKHCITKAGSSCAPNQGRGRTLVEDTTSFIDFWKSSVSLLLTLTKVCPKPAS